MQKARILVVDDDLDSHELFHLHLENDSREICTFPDPESAIQSLKHEHWDVIISDIMMPDVDGFSFVKVARECEPDVPCILMTGYHSDDNAATANKINCFGYINKPFDWTSLSDMVDKAVTCVREYRRNDGGKGC